MKESANRKGKRKAREICLAAKDFSVPDPL